MTQSRPARASHSLYAKAMRRMLRGAFTPDNLEEASGMCRDAVNDWLKSLSRENVITLVEKRKRPDGRPGPRVRVFELVRL